MKTTVGQIVLFRVDEQTQQQIGGYNTTPILPAIIVRVWSNDYVNLKVLTDGPTDVWVTSVTRSDDPETVRTWFLPERVDG